MRADILVAFGMSILLGGCVMFRSRMDDRTYVLRTAPLDPVWDLELYELSGLSYGDTVPDADVFREAGRYYSFAERMRCGMIEYHLDSLRIAAIPHSEKWYRDDRPRLSDSLYAKYQGAYHRFEGSLFVTGDTVWHWLSDQAELETSDQTRTLAQLLKPEHWYLFIYDTEGSTHSLGRRHYVERRVGFYLDSTGQVLHWSNTRKRLKKMKIV